MPITFAPVPEWLQDELSDLVEQALRRLKIPTKLDGLAYLTFAIAETIQKPENVRYITKELYPTVAKRHNTSASCVERGMRTAIQAAWKRGGRETLDEMAGYHLIERPTNSEFIALVANYIRSGR